MPETPPPQSPEEIRLHVEERVREESELLTPPGDTPGDEEIITPQFVRQCLANNKRGDGILYAHLHRYVFLYLKKSQEWYKFSGHYWEPDVFQEYLRGVEKVAIIYKQEADALQPLIDEVGDHLREQKAEVKAATKGVKQAEKAIQKAIKDGTSVADAEKELDEAKEAIANAEEKQRETSTQMAMLLHEQKAFHRRIDSLRKIAGAAECVEWSHVIERPLAITGDELDQQPWLLPCKNGVIDLRTGELRPGTPGDLLSKASPIEYRGFDEECPEWEKFLLSIQPDDEVRDFMHMLLGYSISGLTMEQFIAIFIGPGRNGKGLLFEMLEEILGPLYWAIQSELLLQSKVARSSAGASPDKVALKGRRIVAASETEKGRHISGAMVKELTGNDTINARLLYDKHDSNFRPTHKTFLRSQYVPEGLAKDFALRERLIYINFPYMFVDDPVAKALEDPLNAEWYRPKDRDLKARLLAERSGILAWHVRGFARWYADGKLKPPKQIRQNVEDLQRSEDYVMRFIEDRCEPAPDSHFEVYSHIYYSFVDWFCEEECIDKDDKNQQKRIPSSKTISKELKLKGYRSPDKKETGGTKRVYGLKLLITG